MKSIKYVFAQFNAAYAAPGLKPSNKTESVLMFVWNKLEQWPSLLLDENNIIPLRHVSKYFSSFLPQTQVTTL